MTAVDRPRKQIILAVHFPGVNNTTVWSDPESRSQVDFDSFVHLARTAERGKFDFFFLAEGLRLREHRGRIHDLDVVGRPDTVTILSAIAAVTDRLGLAGTLNATFHEPYELARQMATLDHLSDGRAAWNVVTSSDAFTGENFRRGGFLDFEDRYERAEEFVNVARQLWTSWAAEDLVADAESGRFLASADAGAFEHDGAEFKIHGHYNVPRSPQVHPIIIQAGDSDGGRELAARTADVIFTRHSGYEAGRAFTEDVKRRLGAYGRERADLKIIPAATVVLGDTAAEAQERSQLIKRQQVSPQTAILFLEQLWNRDLSAYDPEGPLPDVDPDVSAPPIVQGRTRQFDDPIATARQWREMAEAKNLSIRQLVIETSGRHSFVGTASQVAEEIDRRVQDEASDGFIFVPHITPGGLDGFVDTVVPLLQERGVFRSEYETTTLRDHLGLKPAGSYGPFTPSAGVRAFADS
jgi:FMN-dependent oxidoreductase (nitrilotriacetate monooxygenase family)